MVVDIFNTQNIYDIVYTDPPWPLKKGGKKSARPNSSGTKLDYPTMDIQDIATLHKEFLSSHTSDYHNVFCWTTEKFLRATEKMFEQMGYTLHIRMIYSKCGMGQAPAFTLRYSHEYLLWFYPKGKMYNLREQTRGKYPSVFESKPTRHSAKPEIARNMLNDMFPKARKIELFARGYAEDWDCWGNEV